MALWTFTIAAVLLVLLVARWLHLARRFAAPELPGARIVRVQGRLQGPHREVPVAREGAAPFDLSLKGPVTLEVDGAEVRVLTDDAVLDAGWLGRPRGALSVGQRITVDGRWATAARDECLYREAGRHEVLDAVRIVDRGCPSALRLALPVVLAAVAAGFSLTHVHQPPRPMRQTAASLRCPPDASLVNYRYLRDRGWLHTCQRRDGRLHGDWASFYRTGSPRRRTHYRHGQLHGSERQWHASGALARQEYHRLGKRHGPAQAWDESGQLRLVGSYLDGRRHGPRWRLSADGRPVEIASYRLGRRHGRSLWWRRDTTFIGERLLSGFRGTPARSMRWVGAVVMADQGHSHGRRHGSFRLWFDSGAYAQGAYHHGKRVGRWELWDRAGCARAVVNHDPATRPLQLALR